MGVNDRRRLVVAAWPFVVAGLVLGACGGSEAGGATRETIDLSTTAFVTRPPATTTTTVPGADDGATVAGEQLYTVQSGDFPLRVAQLFAITVEEMASYNGWAGCSSLNCPQFPGIGAEIKIPPGAANSSAPAPVDDGVEVVTGGEAEQPGTDEGGETGEAIPEPGSNCEPGSYTIEEGDFEGRVATKFDVTVDALRAANAGTADYNIFYVGLQIVIPAKADC